MFYVTYYANFHLHIFILGPWYSSSIIPFFVPLSQLSSVRLPLINKSLKQQADEAFVLTVRAVGLRKYTILKISALSDITQSLK